ncbi:MAG: hypothetical protein ACRBM6_20350 [Geminicoccales bacterium]
MSETRPRTRRTLSVLGLIALSVVVRCGDDDDERDEERQSSLTSSAYAAAMPALPEPSLKGLDAASIAAWPHLSTSDNR